MIRLDSHLDDVFGIWLHSSVLQNANEDPERHLKATHNGGKYTYAMYSNTLLLQFR